MNKRQIRGQRYNVYELVRNAIVAADNQMLDMEKSRQGLVRLGHRNPSAELVIRYARESAILRNLAQVTGAYGFESQIGKIDFSSAENAVSDVNAYLGRRNQAHRARWTANRRGY